MAVNSCRAIVGQQLTASRVVRCSRRRSLVQRVQASGASLDVIKMSPLGDRVLIKPKEKEEKSAGGVILTGGSSGSSMGDSTLTGTVVAVGEEVDVGVAAGDVVLFTKYGSSELETDEGSVNFVVQKSILAKLE
ncbi:hypothetical protein M9434_004141 [Picochlorum sp. BPE23]|nr:hypothetical protein M9434_004141 [Picochlorum sp. BPE23]KAI8113727.1 hypothetical protein M9435_003720 [Picochlorum sp. BPE23]|mmetsp:Transcript_3640/g.7433  ORF Transcript_3640/g.7433 Transcript_3640/m.7433 type:complete len:134 (-) Transcript_3640:404-805(-)